jgi:predicted Rossmann fold flavoprotein
MLLSEARDAGVTLARGTRVLNIESINNGFHIKTTRGDHACTSLVIATGGLSIPKIGATDFGYQLAKQFGLEIITPRAALVPLTFTGELLDRCKSLSGVSIEADVRTGKKVFNEGLLFTHRGLSGPSILQISSYWQDETDISVNMAPETDVFSYLLDKKQTQPKQHINNILADILPKRVAQSICDDLGCAGPLGSLSHATLKDIAHSVNEWNITPTGTEGYRTAEVTLGGVDTRALSSQTMQSNKHPGLYFIGEVIDVTGHLGGFNFQWAWSSGYVAGQNV